MKLHFQKTLSFTWIAKISIHHISKQRLWIATASKRTCQEIPETFLLQSLINLIHLKMNYLYSLVEFDVEEQPVLILHPVL